MPKYNVDDHLLIQDDQGKIHKSLFFESTNFRSPRHSYAGRPVWYVLPLWKQPNTTEEVFAQISTETLRTLLNSRVFGRRANLLRPGPALQALAICALQVAVNLSKNGDLKEVNHQVEKEAPSPSCEGTIMLKLSF